VILVSRAPTRSRELVNFGLPLPPGVLDDPGHVRVVDAQNRELPSAVQLIESWRTGNGLGSLRAVQVQAEVDFATAREAQIRVCVGESKALVRAPVPIEQTLIDVEGLKGPRVIALLPPKWLCESLVAGPQVPTSRSGTYAAYEDVVERNFPGSVQYVNSQVYSDWLFDRTSTWYKQYVRTGDPEFLDAAYRAANFVRLETELEGSDAGIFKLKGRDLKYVYPQAMHLHFLLTGDPRARTTGEIMARFCLTQWDPWYRPERYTKPPLGADPENGRLFWSPRHEAYSLLGTLHGWELTGDITFLRGVHEHLDALEAHQKNPPDGYPPDGSWRQNWALYDPNESLLPGATSAWMTAILVAALTHAWRVTLDPRIPDMILRFCDFLDRKGFQPDNGSAYYVIDCLGPNSVPRPPLSSTDNMNMHDMELAYSFAMGAFFTRHPARRQQFLNRFNVLFSRAVKLDLNHPPRAYNWAFHASSELISALRSIGRC
jgi:hypothetical protein